MRAICGQLFRQTHQHSLFICKYSAIMFGVFKLVLVLFVSINLSTTPSALTYARAEIWFHKVVWKVKCLKKLLDALSKHDWCFCDCAATSIWSAINLVRRGRSGGRENKAKSLKFLWAHSFYVGNMNKKQFIASGNERNRQTLIHWILCLYIYEQSYASYIAQNFFIFSIVFHF